MQRCERVNQAAPWQWSCGRCFDIIDFRLIDRRMYRDGDAQLQDVSYMLSFCPLEPPKIVHLTKSSGNGIFAVDVQSESSACMANRHFLWLLRSGEYFFAAEIHHFVPLIATILVRHFASVPSVLENFRIDWSLMLLLLWPCATGC